MTCLATLAGAAAICVGAPLVGAGSAQASARAARAAARHSASSVSSGNWDALAQYAPRADLASKAEQINVAENLASLQGVSAWSCANA